MCTYEEKLLEFDNNASLLMRKYGGALLGRFVDKLANFDDEPNARNVLILNATNACILDQLQNVVKHRHFNVIVKIFYNKDIRVYNYYGFKHMLIITVKLDPMYRGNVSTALFHNSMASRTLEYDDFGKLRLRTTRRVSIRTPSEIAAMSELGRVLKNIPYETEFWFGLLDFYKEIQTNLIHYVNDEFNDIHAQIGLEIDRHINNYDVPNSTEISETLHVQAWMCKLAVKLKKALVGLNIDERMNNLRYVAKCHLKLSVPIRKSMFKNYLKLAILDHIEENPNSESEILKRLMHI